MKNRKTIQGFLAVLLLSLFTISIIPKIYFHDVIANHKDVVTSCDHPEKIKVCIHQKVFNCEAEELVVKTPYLNAPLVNSSSILSKYHDFNSAYFSSSIQYCFIHKESRGPPVV